MSEEATLDLHVIPGARKSEIAGRHGGRLKVKIKAPPVEGKANEEVCRYIAELFEIRASAVFLRSGEKSRQKSVGLRGVSPAELAARLQTIAPA